MYRVTWGPELTGKLARLYDGLDEKSRERLLAAIDWLDARLLDNPLNLGESRTSPLVRVAIEGPLTVIFRVDDVRQVVRVTGVSYFQRNR